MQMLNGLRGMARQRRVGFTIDEIMEGWHEFEPGIGPGGRKPFLFFATWGPRNVKPWINPQSPDFMRQPLEGWVTMGDVCEKAPCRGSLALNYFRGHSIRYEFDFAADGVDYRYVGEKVNIMPWNLPVSHTTCFGTIKEVEGGRLVSRSVTYFKLWRTPQFMASFRLA
ncbi:MAG: hypothetical protein ACLFOY_05670 [Desulfatibacillaceae bacterium]